MFDKLSLRNSKLQKFNICEYLTKTTEPNFVVTKYIYNIPSILWIYRCEEKFWIYFPQHLSFCDVTFCNLVEIQLQVVLKSKKQPQCFFLKSCYEKLNNQPNDGMNLMYIIWLLTHAFNFTITNSRTLPPKMTIIELKKVNFSRVKYAKQAK